MRSSITALLALGLAACAPALVNPNTAQDGRTTAGDAEPVVRAPAGSGVEDARVGVLVMAHGGGSEWNGTVERAVAPLRDDIPVEIAMGMADRASMARGLGRLADRGVDRVAVVRVFLSGASFLDQTAWYLGLSPNPPQDFLLMGPSAADPAARDRIDHGLTVATHVDGLLAAPEAGRIMVSRAAESGLEPSEASVLLIAHGMGAESENDQVLGWLASIADSVATAGYANVGFETLREDWPEARIEAEQRIRSFVKAESGLGRQVIVLPARLSGFGPYADVLAGLDYIEGGALLPHPAVGAWIRRTADLVICRQGWEGAAHGCPTVTVRPDGTSAPR